MRTPPIPSSLAILACLASLACSGRQETAAAPSESAEAADVPILESGDQIPSQAEADQKAEQQIDENNADAELEKLEKELEGAPGGGSGG